MRRATTLPLLAAAVLLPSGVLAWFGVATFRAERDRAEARFREGGVDAVAAVRSALERELEGLGESNGIRLVVDGDGTVVEPVLEREVEPIPAQDPGLLAYLAAEADRLDRAGDTAGLEELLASSEAGDDPAIGAWATTARWARARRRADAAGALAAAERLETEFAGHRDERGLLRSTAARSLLGETPQELAAVYAELALDHVDVSQLAVASLKARVARRLSELDRGGVWLETRAEDRRRDSVRRLRAVARSGLADWMSSNAAGATRRFDDSRGAFVARVEGDGAAWAADLEELVRNAGEAPEVVAYRRLGFDVAFSGVGSDPAPSEDAITSEVIDPLGVTVTGFGVDREAFFATERRRLRLTTAAAAALMLLSALAGFATLRAVRRQERLASEREGFVAAVTHELKTPLASIRLLAEVLAGGDVEEAKVCEFARRTTEEAERLSRLVSAVLDLSRLERGDAEALRRESVPVNDLVGETLRVFEPMADDRGFQVRFEACEEDPRANLDADAIKGALLNLLDNAVKYATQPHPIVVEVTAGERYVRIAVLDRGRGIPPEEVAHIFEPFRRVGDELVRDRPGAGLGLALVQRVAAAHGGNVRCEPRPGGGTRFELELPTRGAEAAA